METHSHERETAKEERMETDSPSKDKKKLNTYYTEIDTNTHTQHIYTIKFLQINLHYSKAATAALCQQLSEGNDDVELIQEPWLYKCGIRGLTNTGGTVYSTSPENNSRSCIYVRNQINDLPLLEFCSRDATTVKITYTHGRVCEEQIVASAYLAYDSDEPPPNKEVRYIIEHRQSRKNQLIVGCDAKAHHIL
jgi:hypothetical protein